MSILVESLKDALDSVKNDDTVVASVNSLNQLSKDHSSWDKGTQACKYLADALRTASLRSPLGDSGIIENLAGLLNEASGKQLHFQIQALRVLGNLCFDHENNRKRVKDAGIVPTVATYLTQNAPSDLIRTVCGFYLNSSMDYAPIQNEIAECGAAKSLVDLIVPGKEDDGSITMAIKVLDNMVAEETARKVISTPSTVTAYIAMIEHLYRSEEYVEELDNVENLADTLLQLIMDDDHLQNEIVDMGALDFLLDFLESTDIEMQEKDEKEKLEEIRKTMSKITIYATSTDSKMDELYTNRHLLSRFLDMAKSKSEVVHQCAVYILGNLARTDQHCIELVEKYSLSKLLLDLYQTTENATFQYAILGCLKHLCLPMSNKDIIGNDDCIRILSPALDESKDMLKRNQFLTIGIIKLLCAGNYNNTKRIIQENSTLSLVTRFLKRVDDIAAKSEATRVLTNLVKTVWVQNNNNDLRMQLTEAHIMEPITELVRTSKFAVLKNDGIMALTLIFSESSESATTKKALSVIAADPPQPTIAATQEQEEAEEQKEHESRSFLQVLIDDICVESNEIPVQIKCNACVLLCKVAESAKRENDLQVIEYINSIASDRLESIQDNSDLHKYVTTLSKALRQ
ncbi:ARM repeat-containing protein [Mucor ambiguus]|uniref:ARM repeat-containing protein n=1 Tax=Mucor ambiguus TaxID=91626 RepID=A0A0C9N9A4_9FUNG|nr:ARM repeat-containing protein [Mucor ambiguus]